VKKWCIDIVYPTFVVVQPELSCKEEIPRQNRKKVDSSVKSLGSDRGGGGGLPFSLELLTVCQDMSLFQTILV